MKFTSTAFFVSLLAVTLNAAPTLEPKPTKKCYTVHSGYFAVHPNGKQTGVTLNSKNEIVYGKSTKNYLKVDFQSCPAVASWPGEEMWIGRIVHNGQCLTIENPSSANGPYWAKLAKCGSDTKPSDAQSWRYGTSDDRDVVYWVGNDKTAYNVGYESTKNGIPLTEKSTGRLKIGCVSQCDNFNILTKLD